MEGVGSDGNRRTHPACSVSSFDFICFNKYNFNIPWQQDNGECEGELKRDRETKRNEIEKGQISKSNTNGMDMEEK